MSSAVLLEATSAAAGAAISSAAIYPLDLVKVRLQSSSEKNESFGQILSHIVKSEGALALFAGLQSKCFESILSTFSFFYWYVFLKTLVARKFGKLTTGMNLLVAAIAGALNITITLPLDVITTRLQTQKLEKGQRKKTWSQMVAHMFQEGGLSSFWRGYAVAVILCCNPAINFTVYEALKARLEKIILARRGGKHKPGVPILNGAIVFALGAVAKAVATIVTYPLIRAKVILTSSSPKSVTPSGRMEHPYDISQANVEVVGQLPHTPSRKNMTGLLSVLLHVWQTEGFKGWYKGCSEQITLTVIRNAFLLTNKEYIHALATHIVSTLAVVKK